MYTKVIGKKMTQYLYIFKYVYGFFDKFPWQFDDITVCFFGNKIFVLCIWVKKRLFFLMLQGYRTGYNYKHPNIKREGVRKDRSNAEVEVPPSSSSFTYVFDGDTEHSKYM